MRNIRNGDYMLRKLENEIVKECAPTLAGIKMANLFNYRFVSEDEFDSEIKTSIYTPFSLRFILAVLISESNSSSDTNL